MKKHTFLKHILILTFLPTLVVAQSTYNQVYNIFQAKCTSCHNATNLAGSLNLDDTVTLLYNNIVNVNTTNTVALAKHNKLVFPGDPNRSFILRKCLNVLTTENGLETGEGTACPQDTTTQLSNTEVELIRQWILAGAPQTGTVVDTTVIAKYYGGLGINNVPAQHPIPTEPGAFQIHLGKIFMDANSETEYFLKYDLKLPDTVEVNRIEVFMPAHSHHFLIYKFEPGEEVGFPDGIRTQNPLTGEGSSNGNNTLVSAWQYSDNVMLPTGTAYEWANTTVLDLNHHLFNPYPDSVIGNDLYINVYTQPKHTASHIMYCKLVDNTNILILNTSTDYTFSKSDYDSNASNMWNVWLLSSHTHKYGKDYDIYLRNPGGGKGDKIYEGFYNIDYSFDQGYYDWEHPPTRKFDPLFEINPRNGLIQEAVFNNDGPLPVTFGLTTNDEMMLYFIQYTLGTPITTGISEDKTNSFYLNSYPNPFEGSTQITYTLDKPSTVSIVIMDMLGKKVATIANEEEQQIGNHAYTFNPQQYGYSAGAYVVKAIINDEHVSKTIIQTK